MKVVVLCFNKAEEAEVRAFINRIRVRKANSDSQEEIEPYIIYPADVNKDEYMTWKGEEPNDEDKETLGSLTSNDRLFIWGHGSPNYAYIPGAFYTEIGNYLNHALDKDQFSSSKGALRIGVEICNGGRGGALGKNSFAARLHAYLGKLGIYSEVSGRLRNVVIDTSNLPHEGLKTIPRHYDGLSHFISIPDRYYEHQAEQSKVTYAWGGLENKEQIRIDSYRRSLKRDFFQLKEKLLEEVSQSPIINPRNIHQALLAIEFRLSDETTPIQVSLLKQLTEELHQECRKHGFGDEVLRSIGFERFLSSIARKAHANGFLLAKTNTRVDDPKLPIEQKPLSQTLSANSEMQRLNNTVERLRQKNQEHFAPDLETLIKILGCEDTVNENNLYANLFQLYRKILIASDSGEIDLPSHIKDIIDPLVSLLEIIYLDEDLSQNKQQELYKHLHQLDNYTTSSRWGAYLAKSRGFWAGFAQGHRERHEASLLEYLPNLFYSAHNISGMEADFFVGFVKDISQIRTLIERKLSVQLKNSDLANEGNYNGTPEAPRIVNDEPDPDSVTEELSEGELIALQNLTKDLDEIEAEIYHLEEMYIKSGDNSDLNSSQQFEEPIPDSNQTLSKTARTEANNVTPTTNLPNTLKVRSSIIRIPSNEREENIFAVATALNDNDLMRGSDGKIPAIIQEIRNIMKDIDYSDDKKIASGILQIKEKINKSEESNHSENTREIVDAFSKADHLNFRVIRSSISKNEAMAELMDSIKVGIGLPSHEQ
ncbi:TPA: hypothetical protein JBI01_00055 [Legionella pneumophila]|nr:hypothetical protein [Legionella pneumophila]HAU1224985.1 hypothetical protein [Legionella pneumophila]